METAEFREKLHSYHKYMDGKTFINAFIDASKQHGSNLELILQEMEKAKAEYQNKLNK